jgi:predicted nucleic acid-binding protein
MNVLIDTNVVLDQLLKREPFYENAKRIHLLSEKGYINSYISASAVTDIYYIANKELNDKDIVVKLLENLLKTTNVAAVTETGIHEALQLKWDDFEDAVQYVAGKSISAEYIVTRNAKDFTDSLIDVISPEAFLEKITSQ